jgi:hypothetical protein
MVGGEAQVPELVLQVPPQVPAAEGFGAEGVEAVELL